MYRFEEILKYTSTIQIWEKFRQSIPNLIISGSHENLNSPPKFLLNGKFHDCVFVNCNFEGTNFSLGHFRYVSFINCNIFKSSFGNMAEFEKVLFQDCKISPQMFSSTKLLECNFINCELNEGNFRGSEFVKCNLSRLNGLTTDNLEDSIGDLETILPEKVSRPNSWDLFVNSDQPTDKTQFMNVESSMLEVEGHDVTTNYQKTKPSAVEEDKQFPTISITSQNLPFIKNQALFYARICRDQIEFLRGANDLPTIAKNRPVIELLEILKTGCEEIAEEAGKYTPANNIEGSKKRLSDKAAQILEMCEDVIAGKNGTMLQTFSNVAIAGVSIGFLTLFGAPPALATGGVFALMGIRSISKTQKLLK